MKIDYAPNPKTVAFVAKYSRDHAASVHALDLTPSELEVKVGRTPEGKPQVQVVGERGYWVSVDDGPMKFIG